MANAFYTSKRWKRLRLQVLRRDKFKCVRCRWFLRSRDAVVVHHIKNREEYPELQWEMSNLISLCNGCHNKLHPEKGINAKRFKNF